MNDSGLLIYPQITPMSALHLRNNSLRFMDARDEEAFSRNQFSIPISRSHFESAQIVIWEDEIFDAAGIGSAAFSEMPPAPRRYSDRMMAWFKRERNYAELSNGTWIPFLFTYYMSDPLIVGAWWLLHYTDGDVKWQGSLCSSAQLGRLKMPDVEPIQRMHLAGLQTVVARYHFLDQPFVEFASEAFPRHERRRAEREQRVLPDVRTIKLRRAENNRSAASSGVTREFQHRWLVGAHWRKATARMKEPHPVYVRPYIKGPSDKPFRAPRETVYAAKR